eukprot:TRINITY_DN62965_c0_g1_i1.p1 TRINITY_DN62965_c0_g1~~TRINITY_DN62965_c0_g1_i1.p1  ORF type:complete len:310 (-),score=29.98 TRINITY_DN62965_c0_g1_i1:759-1688(-)
MVLPQAHFVADYSFDDGVKLAGGACFAKAWTVRNSGEVAWGGDGYRLVHRFGSSLGLAVDAPLPLTLPGESTNIVLQMLAPMQPGTYKSQWTLESDTGTLFGPLLHAEIVVVPSTAECAFVTDATLPDGATVTRGELVRKTWRLQNCGECNLVGHALCFSRDDDSALLGATIRSVPLPPACPGEEFDVSVDLCPQSAGTGTWILRGPAGLPIRGNHKLWVSLQVQDPTSSVASIVADNPMQLLIRTLVGRTLTIDFETSDTVDAIKSRIQEKEGIPPDQQQLIYQGLQLDNDRTLGDCNISSGRSFTYS